MLLRVLNTHLCDLILKTWLELDIKEDHFTYKISIKKTYILLLNVEG